MDTEQERLYRTQLNDWIAAVKRVPGWAEDDVSSAPSEIDIQVTMPRYTLSGVFRLPDVQHTAWMFANPECDIQMTASEAPKCNLNRFCRSLDETVDALQSYDRSSINIWEFLQHAHNRFVDLHEGQDHEIRMRTKVGRRTTGLATKVPSTWDIALEFFINTSTSGVQFTVPVHTVCPFMLLEADGHSHTQRTYLTARIPTVVHSLDSILSMIDERMQIAQSSMKIPDEAIHCLRAYTVPTYTEDGGRRLAQILRDTKSRWTLHPAQSYYAWIHVRSLESIFTVDIEAEFSTWV